MVAIFSLTAGQMVTVAAGSAELAGIRTLCGFIQSNGTGFGVVKLQRFCKLIKGHDIS